MKCVLNPFPLTLFLSIMCKTSPLNQHGHYTCISLLVVGRKEEVIKEPSLVSLTKPSPLTKPQKISHSRETTNTL